MHAYRNYSFPIGLSNHNDKIFFFLQGCVFYDMTGNVSGKISDSHVRARTH